MARLGDLATYINGRPFKPSDWGTTGRPIIRIQNLTDPSAPFNFYTGSVDERNLIRAGDLLVSWSASLDAFIWHRGEAILNQHIFKVVEKTSSVDRQYLYYALREVMGEIRKQTHGATMKHINKPEFEAFEIPLPPLPQQQRIAQALKTRLAVVERGRQVSAERLQAASALTAAYLREVFETEEADEWQEFSLGDLALIVQNGLYKKAEFYGSGEPLIRMYNVDNGTWRLNHKELASVILADDEKEKFRLQARDLLVSRVNSYEQVGKSGIVSDAESSYFFENMLIRLRFVPEVDPLFMVQQLATRRVREALRGVAKRAIGQVSINSSDLRNLKVRLPDINRQKQISLLLDARIDSAASLRKLVSEEVLGFADIPSVLLRQAFSGAL
jgi:type I restriction enzyme S subunit